ncbi:MAG TPA: hypothetical protein VFJ21_06380 [Mycobacteriales bacterium]|jgi:hypothetical protein|nr:hypothetical protein [Mycobacteriales bacterium]
MKRIIAKAALTIVAAGGVGVVTVTPALAGQFYPAPGFPSSGASCMGAAYDFAAHYGVDPTGSGDGVPPIVHGQVGPSVSGHATTDGPGAVGEFSSSMAQNHGSVLDCLP